MGIGKKPLTGRHDFIERLDDEVTVLDQDENTWAVPFSDVVTVLLIFFILLLSFSVINPNKYEVVQKSIKGINIDTTNIKELERNINKVIQEAKVQESVRVVPDDLGLNIEFQNQIMFASGSARLNQSTRNLLNQIMSKIVQLPKQYMFYIEGHTDDVPVAHNSEFRSNWHLSAARALSVLSIFSDFGVQDNRLRVEGFADTHPLKDYPLKDEHNNSIVNNREKNRRVVIKVR